MRSFKFGGGIVQRHAVGPPPIQQNKEDAVVRARSLWAESDRLRNKARVMHDEADALARAAERLNRMAAAIADGRDNDLVEEALSVGNSSK